MLALDLNAQEVGPSDFRLSFKLSTPSSLSAQPRASLYHPQNGGLLTQTKTAPLGSYLCLNKCVNK